MLILAAGKGTRLGELGTQTAKVLVPIGERPLLDLHLEHLERQGVRRVVINAHHLAEQITDHIAAYDGPLQIDVLVEAELLGTAGAAINALEALGNRAFIVIYGDVMLFEVLAPVLRAHAEHAPLATLCVYQRQDTSGKGVVDVDERGRVTGFAEKDPARTGPGIVNAGLYVIEPALLAGWPAGQFLDFGHDIFPAALEAGHHLHVHEIAEVLDIGTPSDLARARAIGVVGDRIGVAPPQQPSGSRPTTAQR